MVFGRVENSRRCRFGQKFFESGLGCQKTPSGHLQIMPAADGSSTVLPFWLFASSKRVPLTLLLRKHAALGK
jgi:hypothetical protein